MKKATRLIGFCVLVTLACIISVGYSDTVVKHVHFVDKAPNLQQYLFRGGIMDIDGPNCGFDYTALTTAIAQAAKDAQIALPEKYFLIDINLLNLIDQKYPCDDSRETLTEFQFFEKNPHLGQFIFWQTYGDKDNASTPYFTPTFMTYLARTLDQWQGDNIIGRTEALRKMLRTPHPSGMPLVIYGHCDCGCDRTGELYGSYYMRYMGYSWEKANTLNTVIAERPMGCDPWRAMQWFCLWLNEIEGKNLNCMKYEPCTVQD